MNGYNLGAMPGSFWPHVGESACVDSSLVYDCFSNYSKEKKEKEMCNVIVFNHYLHNCLYWNSVFSLDLNYCLCAYLSA